MLSYHLNLPPTKLVKLALLHAPTAFSWKPCSLRTRRLRAKLRRALVLWQVLRSLFNSTSIPVPRAVILGTDDQTSALLRPLVNRLHDIDQLLLVFQHPVQLVIVPCAKVTHHMLIAVEEHQCATVIKLIHLVEGRDLVDVAEVENGEVPDALGDFVQHLDVTFV